MGEYIAFDSHKRYTWVEHEYAHQIAPDLGQSCLAKKARMASAVCRGNSSGKKWPHGSGQPSTSPARSRQTLSMSRREPVCQPGRFSMLAPRIGNGKMILASGER